MIPIRQTERGKGSRHLEASIAYITNKEKTENGEQVSAINCVPERAYEQMRATAQIYGKEDGRQGYHMIISFKEKETDAQTVEQFARDFVGRYLKDEYETVIAVHTNTRFPHAHIVFNSVNMMTGYKYYCPKGEMEKVIRPLINQMCVEYGLQEIPQKERDSNHQVIRYWDEKKDGPFVWTEMIRKDVDECIRRTIKENGSFFDFIHKLKELGYEVKHGKYLAVKPRGMKRFRRLYQLGEDYTEAAISQRIKDKIIKDPGDEKRQVLGKKVTIRSYHKGQIKGLKKMYLFQTYQIVEIKTQSYSRAWKYYKEIQKFEVLKKQYELLSRNDISTENDLDVLIHNNEDVENELTKERIELYRKKKRGLINDQEAYEKRLGMISEQLKNLRTTNKAAKQIKTDIHEEQKEYELNVMECKSYLGNFKGKKRAKGQRKL